MTVTLGTTANNGLTAVVMNGAMATADVATIMTHILNDLISGTPIYPGAFSQAGLLYVPNRGILQARVGDYVAYDNVGWPILVSANSIANGAWTHT